MNTFQLKLLACLFMLIDHVGAVLFPQYLFFRAIGRLAFPIFAYLITIGYKNTGNLKKYLIRLFCFALFSQIPFHLAFEGILENQLSLNIFFTLFLGLLALFLYEKYDHKFFIILIISMIAEFAGTDYGLYGILTIFIFYKYNDDFRKMLKSQIILNIFYTSVIVFSVFSSYSTTSIFSPYLYLQNLSLLSLVLIKFYNNEKGKSLKYLFYIFYPLHLIVIHIIDILG